MPRTTASLLTPRWVRYSEGSVMSCPPKYLTQKSAASCGNGVAKEENW